MSGPRLITDRMLDLFVQDRSPGLHVSPAIYRIMRKLHPDRFGGDAPIDQVRADLGNAFENALADAWHRSQPDRYVRPGELEFDGLAGTPDLWDLQEWATVEIKLTWASARRAEDIEDEWFWRYWAQLKSYAYMAGMTKGYLVICFINGDYRDSGPVSMMWEQEWTREELYENWEMIKAHSQEEERDEQAV